MTNNARIKAVKAEWIANEVDNIIELIKSYREELDEAVNKSEEERNWSDESAVRNNPAKIAAMEELKTQLEQLCSK